MRKPRSIARYICELILPLTGLISGATLVQKGASAQTVTPSWTLTGDLNTPRYAHTATLLPNGKVLVAGGLGPNSCSSTPTSTAELYDAVSGTWSATGNLNTARSNHTATLLRNGQVLVAGGYAPQVSLNSPELYDPATGMWRPTGSFNTIRVNPSATLLPNGKVLAVGASSAELTSISAELYDPATETWSSTGAPSFVPGGRHTVLLPNGKVLAVFEGSPWDYAGVGTELYDPATGQWSTAGYLNMFWAPTVTLLRNGKVLVTGLYGGNNPTQAELYDTDTGTWSITGNLSTFRHYGGYTATLLANGQVLVAGGVDYITQQPVRAEELYDPATGTWTLTSRLIRGRGSHTATLLRNGKVLVAGGVDGLSCDSPIHPSGELYDPGITSTTIYDPQFFVRQHYLDFLNREPDASGLSFWTNEITQCAGDAQCIEAKRADVSAAFFVSIEFQETGYLVLRMYKASYGDRPGTPVPLTRQDFLPDTQRVGQGVVVDAPGWEQQLENNKNAFASEFVARSRFTTAFPQGMTAAQFVDALNANAGGALSQSERNQLVSELASGAKTRAQVLRSVAETLTWRATSSTKRSC